jgi:hypothetical protein
MTELYILEALILTFHSINFVALKCQKRRLPLLPPDMRVPYRYDFPNRINLEEENAFHGILYFHNKRNILGSNISLLKN